MLSDNALNDSHTLSLSCKVSPMAIRVFLSAIMRISLLASLSIASSAVSGLGSMVSSFKFREDTEFEGTEDETDMLRLSEGFWDRGDIARVLETE